MEKKTYLVTGASGFIGRSLVERLRRDGHIVRCAVRRATHGADDIECPLGASVDTWLSAIDGVDGVFHLAWSTVPRTANSAPLDDVATNVLGTVALLEAMRRCPGVPFVFASSGGTVYGVPEARRVSESHPLRPLGVYGASKASVEGYAMLYRRQFGVDARILRVSNPFGPGQKVEGQLGAASIFAWRALAGLDIQIWGDGSVVRDYLYIEDAVDAFVATMGATADVLGQGDPIFNIGSGEGTSLKQIVETIGDILGTRVCVKYEGARSFDVPVSILDISRAKNVLGWIPKTSFRDGMTETIARFSKSMAYQPCSD
ncbi:NAD-dependent epimerase/dehydratase family protein [Burkholderia multivorans]|uniref:NAD-dependent epimerase/dehydratase family protein n=1 Tax=Burkholderia multivorans TaxID=87883 RepID=UPI001C22608E|nr:NAD-dependent epimerase/dehydratase family protein [Burkholderia multivorans]MBU9227189.1 NAD-dependent epimerase/dehydratase family protein [Burkholderia multivorans]MBU9313194.1 NAD-dependent epimerase/dehydratase family protein [Burkholderia multivorans]MCA8247700.1 NAD-dependent epimerase/dehydratase family protein [Burkholderia multivorans]